MYDYYEPLRSESSNGLFNLPFLAGASVREGNIVLVKCFTSTQHNPLVFKLKSERPRPFPDRIELDIESLVGDFTLTLFPLTPEYVLLHKELYPFTEQQLQALAKPGVLSLFAQAAIPVWFEEQYPPPDEPAEPPTPPTEAVQPEYRDVAGVLYERAPDGSWVKAK